MSDATLGRAPVNPEDRRTFVGASDLAAIMGLSQFQNRYDLWLYKTGQIPAKEQTEAMSAGIELEPVVLANAENKLGCPLTRNVRLFVPFLALSAQLDGMTPNKEPLDAKTEGIVTRGAGLFDGDDPPVIYAIQVYGQLLASRINHPEQAPDVGYLHALVGGKGWIHFAIPWDEGVGELIAKDVNDFVAECRDMRPPDNLYPNLDSLKQRLRVQRKRIERMDLGDLIDHWQCVKQEIATGVKLKEELEQRILTELGDAEELDFGGEKILQYALQKRAGYTVEPTEYRTLRLVKRAIE